MQALTHTAASGRQLSAGRPAPTAVARVVHPLATPPPYRLARTHLVCTAGKKGGGSKKPAQKKGGSALAGLLQKKAEAENAGAAGGGAAAGADGDALARREQYADPEVLVQLMMITAAYKKQYGE